VLSSGKCTGTAADSNRPPSLLQHHQPMTIVVKVTDQSHVWTRICIPFSIPQMQWAVLPFRSW
jgi:hypothetical protein